MIVLNNEQGDTIKISFAESQILYIDRNLKRVCNKIELPTVICTNKSDAQMIQEKINTYTLEFCRKLLEEKN